MPKISRSPKTLNNRGMLPLDGDTTTDACNGLDAAIPDP
jgi:hypothetical protein